MTRERTSPHEKLRAFFLATLMVLSVFSGSIAFAGTTLADTEAVANASAGNAEIGQASATQTVSFDAAIDSGNTDTVTVDLSSAVGNGAEINGIGEASSSNPDAVSADITDEAGNTAEIELTDGDEEGSSTVSFDVDYDTSSLSATPSGVTYDITSADTDESDTASFDFVDTIDPSVENARISETTGDDGIVADGHEVTVSATVTDAGSGVDSVDVDASAFGADDVELTNQDEDDNTYAKTFTVGNPGDSDEGDQTLNVVATDGESNEGSSETNALTVDNVAPSVTFEDSFPDTVAGDSVNLDDDITVENTDSQSPTYEYDDGDGWTEIGDIGNFNSTAANDGTVTIRVTATDDADNEEQKQRDLEVDNQPTVETNFGDSNVISGNSVDVTSLFTVDDNGDSTDVSYKIGEDSITSPSSFDSSQYDDGTYTLAATATDDGDKSDDASGDIIIDNKAPSVTFEDSFPNTVSGDSVGLSDDITVENTDSTSPTYEYDDGDDDGWTEIGDIASFDSTAANDGTVTIRVTATDDANNEEQKQTTLEVDNSGPSNIEIVEPTSEVFKESEDTLQVAYEYSESNPDSVDITLNNVDTDDSYTYEVDESQYVDDGATKTVTLDLSEGLESESEELADGTYDLSLQVTDQKSHSNSVTENGVVVVDDAAPTDVSVDKVSDDKVADDDELTVDYSYTDDNPSSVVVTLSHENEGTNDSVSFDLNESDYAGEDGQQSETLDLSAADSMSGDGLVDGQSYDVTVEVTDELEHVSSDTTSDTVIIDNAQPTLDNVEAEAGTETVTVEFSEGVHNGDDGALAQTDITYQNKNNDDASGIKSIEHEAGSATATLTLKGTVSADDLGTDLVGVREDSVYDASGTVVDVSAETLSDTESPSQPTIDDAGPITTDNQGAYTVTVDLASDNEQGTVEVTLDQEGSDSVSTETDVKQSAGEAEVELDASSFDDGDVSITATMTDEGGNDASDSVTVVKDTVAPTIEVAAANPAGSTDVSGEKTQLVWVQFSEPVASSSVSADAFTLTSDAHSIDQTVALAADEALLVLNQSVTPEAIDNESVQVEAPGVTDGVGYTVENAVNLTDEPTGSLFAPPHTPGFSSVSAEPGDVDVTVTFDEVVEAGDGDDLTADNFTYENNNGESANTNGESASGIKSVTQTGPQTVVVTMHEELTAADLDADELGVAEDGVFDTSGNAMEADSTVIGLEAGLSASAEDDTVTVQVTTLNDIETAVGDGLTVSESNSELAELEGFTLEERFTTSVAADDFSEVDPGVYEATVDAPEDGMYTASGLVDGEMSSAEAAVDTHDPKPTDAVILDDFSASGNFGSNVDGTIVRVQFNEPIDTSGSGDPTITDGLTPSDVDIEGYDGEVLGVTATGSLGVVDIHLSESPTTAPGQSISIDGDSYTEVAGSSHGVEDASTVLHTDKLDLKKGQNFVSVPAEAGELSISELDTSDVDAIYAYDAASESWDAYDPDAKENDFTDLEGGEGYIFEMDADATLDVNVYTEPVAEKDMGPVEQDLSEGWNLIGHYQEFDQTVDTALSSVGMDDVHEVYAPQDDSNGFEFYSEDEFTTMERGDAYWVMMQDDEAYSATSLEAVES